MAKKEEKRKADIAELLLVASLLILTTILIILFWTDNLLLTAIGLVVTILAYKYLYMPGDLKLFFTGAVIGPIGEIVLISYGVWAYANPSFLGIPLWMPFVWGNAVVAMKWFADAL